MSEINFACKVISLDTVLKCSFGIKKTDVEILKIILHSYDDMTTQEIMKKIEKDKTTVQRSMKSLFEKNLVKRRQQNLENGGFIFLYSAVSKDEILTKIYANLENFKLGVAKEITKM
jgi:predicted transcriptional regulator